MTTTTYVQVEAPPWVTAEHFKKAVPVLSKVMKELGRNDNALRGYIYAANLDGFPVKAGFATTDQLQEIATRAFWWIFEQIVSGKRAPDTGALSEGKKTE